MNKVITIIIILILLVAGYMFFVQGEKDVLPEQNNETNVEMTESPVSLESINHATFILTWGDIVIYNDPVGNPEAFAGKPEADIILISDVHGDHLNAETLESVLAENTLFIAPQAVVDELPEGLASRARVLANGEATGALGITIEATPMYNLPESEDSRHTKGRGNGYVLERDGYRVYIAGDTADIPEMRALSSIDIAFVPMNLPYTMDVNAAADAVLEFKPRTVYPYHYRGQDGLSDIHLFKQLVNEGDSNIEVVLLDWYPD